MTVLRIRSLSCLWFYLLTSTAAWKQCPDDKGGGTCPDKATCCPTNTPGVSSCLSSKTQDPEGMGHCCDDDDDDDDGDDDGDGDGDGDDDWHKTGCAFGFTCALDDRGESSSHSYCQLEPNAPGYLVNDTNRYQLCTVSDDRRKWFGFDMEHGNDNSKIEDDAYQVPYYSSMGDIKVPSTAHLQVETVVLVIHGSTGNADDYFCTGLSLLEDAKCDCNHDEKVLVLTPKFASPEDEPIWENLLVWADHNEDEHHPLSHSWRYGADAMNAPISSYTVLDAMVEYLVRARMQFPNIVKISLAGHSAGGQMTHRWALLSNSPVWEEPIVEIRAIVANPRSFCYLDGRRILKNGSYDLPDPDEIAVCSGYNQWQWGLDAGGTLDCPYKDQALQETPLTEMAKRYATRHVIYLSGQDDVLPTTDRCETSLFQGPNRQERARNYMKALQEYYGRPVQQWHLVYGSPHDHSLMFQSPEGRAAILG